MITIDDITGALNTIRQTYVDEVLGEKVATAIEEYIETPTGKNRMGLEDPGAFLWELNSILSSITHDMHFGFSRAHSSGSQTASDLGIVKYTPHYVYIKKFESFSREDVRQKYMRMFAQLQDPVVFDLRYCSGGDMETLFYVLCHFFPDNTPLFDCYTRANPLRSFKAQSKITVYDTSTDIKKFTGRVKVLINGHSYSAAEVFAKIMQSHGRAKIFGTGTAGAGYAKLDMQFGDIILSIPFIKFIDPMSKEDHEGIGITPDFGPASAEYISTIFSDVWNENI